MKKYWIASVAAGLLTIAAVAQTTAGGAASGSAQVGSGQAGANTTTSTSAQTSGASANADASANAKVSHEHESKTDKGSSAAGGSGSGSAGSAASGALTSGALTSGTTLQAELTRSVDSKKAKPGDEVTARLTQDVKADGRVVAHKGSKLVGHVTEAQARSKENAESKLGIVFDKAVLKGGQELKFNGAVQALAPPVEGALNVAGDESSSLGSGMGSGGGSMGGGRSGGGVAPMGGGGVVGGAASTVGSTVGSATGAVGGSVNNAAVGGTLNSAARGVVGMQGVVLNSSAAGSAQGSVISSANRNVKLDSGTQMVLQVTGSAASQ